MPTAAALIAALGLGLIGFVVSGQVMPRLPEGMDFGWFVWVNVGLGFLCGWIIMGKRAGRGLTWAINNGVTGAAAVVFWALFVQGSYEMFQRAMRNRYDGPLEAIVAVFEIGVFEYAPLLAHADTIGTLVIGGILTGIATEIAARQWR
ncbi:TrgA family protein [Lutimaribacter marinistellae]|uniref:TrgA family protein n=1 Tax=Lutimaribacter marinistellae TaxID=1820329 RepID=A0ABV7TMJ1_9RHOB